MSEDETVERRLSAVERALTDGDHAVADLQETGELVDRVESLETELDALQERVTDLEAATQALRGYVGNVRSVNRDVEQRADAAIAAVDRLEDRVAGDDGTRQGRDTGPTDRRDPANEKTRTTAEQRCDGCGRPTPDPTKRLGPDEQRSDHWRDGQRDDRDSQRDERRNERPDDTPDERWGKDRRVEPRDGDRRIERGLDDGRRTDAPRGTSRIGNGSVGDGTRTGDPIDEPENGAPTGESGTGVSNTEPTNEDSTDDAGVVERVRDAL